jgi:hypothetical protein
VTLQPSTRRIERLLLFGTGGVGKTHAALQVARAAVASGRLMYVVETDPAWDACLEHPDFGGMGYREEWHGGDKVDEARWESSSPLVIHRARDWPQTRDAMAWTWDRARDNAGGWITVDNQTLPWNWIKPWYQTELYGRERDEFLLSIRRAQIEAGRSKDGKATEGEFNEYDFINPHYQTRMTDLLLNPPCHLIVTAEETGMSERFDKGPTRTLYGKLGVKPNGQKQSPHLTHTVLHMTKTAVGEYRLTTVKDRGGRDEWERAEWEDFPTMYLEETAGWTRTSSGTATPRPKPKPRGEVRPKPTLPSRPKAKPRR